MGFVDLFCGYGGAAEGARRAGVKISAAVNHDLLAIGVHEANHPEAEHFRGDIWHADPMRLCPGVELAGLWASPDCTHFSRAKGGKPRSSKVRALADAVVPWLRLRRPPVFYLENVPEFLSWGPLDDEGQPIEERKGEDFERWRAEIEALGYKLEWRILRACDFGAATSRSRFFLVGRCDGAPVSWPEPTHGPGRLPYLGTASIIDWSVPAPSIFERAKPYSPATMRRIARALNKYVLGTERRCIVPGGAALATMIQTSYGERPGQAPRIFDIHRPLTTVVAGGGKHALVIAVVVKQYGGNVGRGASLLDPLPTVTTKDHNHLALALAVPGAHHATRVTELLESDEERHRFPRDLVVDGETYAIVDVRMRQLTVRERALACGFGEDYILDRTASGRRIGVTRQARMVGNSAPPHVVERLLRANQPRAIGVAA